MSRTALRRVVRVSVLLIALSLGLGYFRVGGTFALWQGEATNTGSAFAAGWIGPPTGLGTPTPSGYGASLSWTPGTHGPVTGQEVYGVDGGTGSSASCGTYTLLTTLASASTTAYTDAGTSAANGHWWCYEIVSTSATAWTASAAFTPIRVGLIPSTVALANGTGTSGTIDAGDTITVTFNQTVGTVSGSTNVCTFSGSGVILIGDTGCGAATDSYTIGKLSGLTLGGTADVAATVSSTGAQITVSVTGTGPTASGTGTLTASTSITSSTGSAAACTASNCQIAATGGF